MKIEAKIQWVIDDEVLGITSGKTETVDVDMDYVESYAEDIENWILNELSEKYGTSFTVSYDDELSGDFVIMNMSELLEDLAYDEFADKTDAEYAEV